MNKNLKKIITCTLAIGIISSTNCVSVFASGIQDSNIEISNEETNSIVLSAKDKNDLKEWMNQYGVSELTQEDLLKKLEDGQAWDSMNGSEPIKVEKLDDFSIKESYKDGSISISGVYENNNIEENSEVSTYSLSGGTTSSGSGYMNVKNKKVYKNTGTINAQFYADYTVVKGGHSYISKVYNKKVIGIGCTISEVSLYIDKAKQDGNGPAEATLDFMIAAYSGVAGGNCYLKLFVGNDASSAFSF